MPTKKDKKKGTLTNKYRVVILEDDTLGEVKTMKISKLGVVFATLFIGLMFFLLTTALICFTPLRYFVPGYADIKNNMAYMEVVNQLDVIESELDAHRVYTSGVKNLLNPSGIKVNESDDSKDYFRNSLAFDKNTTRSSNAISLEHYYFCSPLKGEVSAEFDLNKKHFGIDIVAEKDTPIKSILSGVVVSADSSIETGNNISIQHDNDLISVYKHNSVLLKKVGQMVEMGEVIAIIGNTGAETSGPHAHIELWHNGRAVNPAHYIEFK